MEGQVAQLEKSQAASPLDKTDTLSIRDINEKIAPSANPSLHVSVQPSSESKKGGNSLLPLLILPTKITQQNKDYVDTSKWINEDDMSTYGLNLIYDLAAVAVLTIFSQAHEVSSAKAIGSFASFFVLMWYIYLSQISYDVRFQANDWYHRFMKFVQLVAFVMVGAASGGWAPMEIQVPDDPTAENAPSHYSAKMSFLTIAWAYAFSRCVLGVQYLILLIIAYKSKRPIRPFLVPILGITGCCVLVVIAASLHASSPGLTAAKITLFYSAVAFELIAEGVTANLKSHINPSAERLLDRLSSFTLIILGEGFISLLRAFNNALASFSLNDVGVYVACFAAVAILFFCWIILFNNTENPFWRTHSQNLLYTMLHFPLHFAILLLLIAMANTVMARAYTWGVNEITNNFYLLLDNLDDPAAPLNEGLVKTILLQVGKLQLSPSFSDEIEMLNNTDNNNDLFVMVAQYQAQIIINAADDYGVHLHEHVGDLYATLMNITLIGNNYTAAANTTGEAQALQSITLFNQIAGELFTSSVQGTLWLLPSAGAFLCMGAILSWYRSENRGWRSSWSEIFIFTVGTVLGLLGLLDIGDTHIEIDFFGTLDLDPSTIHMPWYRLLLANWALPMVAIIYAIVCIVQQVMVWHARRKTEGYKMLQISSC